MNNKRFKNPWFWVGLIGILFTSIGVNPETFTSWQLVKESILQLLSNPYMIGSSALALLGVFVDPTTNGIKDK